jgi:hypothetical protein
MAKISEAQKKAYKKYRKNNKEKFREHAARCRKAKGVKATTKYIDYIDLIKEYSKTMHYAKIATELQKQIPDKTFNRANIRLFCIANDIKCQTKQAQKRSPRLILTPEQRSIIKSNTAKAYYEKNKEKILAKNRKKYEDDREIRQIVKAEVATEQRDLIDNLIDRIKAIAENKCIIAEDVADLNAPSKTIEFICKKIGYFYIKPDMELAELKPREVKVKTRKQARFRLLANINAIKLEAEKSNIVEMARVFEVHPLTLSSFCKNHKIKTLKTPNNRSELMRNRDKKVCEMLKNGAYIEDIMQALNITHKQYNDFIYTVAKNNNLLDTIKFLNKDEFRNIRKQECYSYVKKGVPAINNTLEFSEDNTKFVIRNTQKSFR